MLYVCMSPYPSSSYIIAIFISFIFAINQLHTLFCSATMMLIPCSEHVVFPLVHSVMPSSNTMQCIEHVVFPLVCSGVPSTNVISMFVVVQSNYDVNPMLSTSSVSTSTQCHACIKHHVVPGSCRARQTIDMFTKSTKPSLFWSPIGKF